MPRVRSHLTRSSRTAPYAFSQDAAALGRPVRSLLSGSDQALIDRVVWHAWTESTIGQYSSAVQDFVSFCGRHGISASRALPASEEILCFYVASMAGAKAGKTAGNKISGLCSWHIRNNLPWEGSLRLKYALKGTENLRPPGSFRSERPPFTLDMLAAVHPSLDLENGLDACIWAMSCTALWGQIRLGELLPKRESQFAPEHLPKWSNFGFPSQTGTRKLHLPRTKRGGTKGEDVIISSIHDAPNPITALFNHSLVNNIDVADPIACYINKKGKKVALTARKLVTRLNPLLVAAGFPTISGHCFRIGGTTTLLLRGVPPDIVKILGRWTSDSFLRYWRSLEIIAPMYIERLRPWMDLYNFH